MTVIFIIGLCLAGFVLGFIAVYVFRRLYTEEHVKKGELSSKMGEDVRKNLAACAWCGKKDYSKANPEYICKECGTVHHLSCWSEYGGCSIFDCKLAPVKKYTKV